MPVVSSLRLLPSFRTRWVDFRCWNEGAECQELPYEAHFSHHLGATRCQSVSAAHSVSGEKRNATSKCHAQPACRLVLVAKWSSEKGFRAARVARSPARTLHLLSASQILKSSYSIKKPWREIPRTRNHHRNSKGFSRVQEEFRPPCSIALSHGMKGSINMLHLTSGLRSPSRCVMLSSMANVADEFRFVGFVKTFQRSPKMRMVHSRTT